MSSSVIGTNINALVAHRNMTTVANTQTRASQSLSSGKRINQAADDVAGMGIAEKMRAQTQSLDRASMNTQDGISLVQTAEGALSSITDMLIRMKELTIQAANDTNVHDPTSALGFDRQVIQNELDQLMFEINNVAYRTHFSTRVLLDGSNSLDNGDGLWIHTGANYGNGMQVGINSVTTESLGAPDGDLLDLVNVLEEFGEDISPVLAYIERALTRTANERSNLGAFQNRMEFAQIQNDITSENLKAAKSRIEDADMAREHMRLVQANILQQASTSVLAQANQAPQTILQLLNPN
ncbi:MAG: flagellin [Firmicutes bacterium]|nr:flagellin [Bacillota bacterium]